jgi:hypothetical protein
VAAPGGGSERIGGRVSGPKRTRMHQDGEVVQYTSKLLRGRLHRPLCAKNHGIPPCKVAAALADALHSLGTLKGAFVARVLGSRSRLSSHNYLPAGVRRGLPAVRPAPLPGDPGRGDGGRGGVCMGGGAGVGILSRPKTEAAGGCRHPLPAAPQEQSFARPGRAGRGRWTRRAGWARSQRIELGRYDAEGVASSYLEELSAATLPARGAARVGWRQRGVQEVGVRRAA